MTGGLRPSSLLAARSGLAPPLLLRFEVSQNFLQDILWRSFVRDDFQICVRAGVGEPRLLLVVFGAEPVKTAGDAGFIVALKINQNVRVGNLLPHAGSKGMFLYDLAGFVSCMLQTIHQRGLARFTRTDDSNFWP